MKTQFNLKSIIATIKNKLPISLFGRTVLIFIIPVILIQLLSTYIFFERHWLRVSGLLARAVAGEISLVSENFSNIKQVYDLDLIHRYYMKHLEIDVEYINKQSLEHKDYPHYGWEFVVKETLSKALSAKLSSDYYVLVDRSNKLVTVTVELNEKEGGGVLIFKLPQNRLFSSSGYIFLLWMFSISFVLIAVAIIFIKNQIRPIRRLAVAAEQFGKGNDVTKLKPAGASEIRQATTAFIEMHERIKKHISQRTIMLAGVSHDLRTPITRMKLHLEMIDEKNDEIEACKQDLDLMQKMINGYLDFARGENNEKTIKYDIILIIDKIIEGLQKDPEFVELNKKIEVIKPENEIKVNVKLVSIERCLSNIINNAVKFADEIRITFSSDEGHINVIIEDNGQGIPDNLIQEAFKPFYRCESSRSLDSGSVGLGIPIANDIVNNHGGEMKLSSSELLGGLKVTIKLPL